ncbi:MAG: Asp23/Gls24 family envelope stress response protein [Oscillospiraceae bacterium]|nr:Asp23/Gls24 family envelope stress response protein [Oscillospiraceae bacterium]
MNIEQNQPNGSLKISQDVIAAIAKHAVEEISGIHSLTASRLPIKNIGNISRTNLSRISTKPVLINLTDDTAVIDISVIVKAGCKIRTVAEEMQKAVKDAVQTMCGITVSKVNVHVEGIQFETETPVVTE